MTALAVRDGGALVQRGPVGLIRPLAAPAEVLKAQEETRTLVQQILQEGRDFGVIPGTDKPTMLKPGAERTALAFGCYYGEPEIVEREIDHDRIVEYTKKKKVWNNAFDGDRSFENTEVSGTSRGLYRYVVRVPVIHRETGQVVGSAIGSCSTMESKYIDRPRDSENTALKMAHKRALVGACLITFGLSDQFTQDVEDIPREQLVGENAPKLEALDPPCPKCQGKMYDNRLSKKSAKQPDFKCKNKQCDGVIWPPREGEKGARPTSTSTASSGASGDATSTASAATSTSATTTTAATGTTTQTDLDRAEAHILPGGPTSWNNQGGKPIGGFKTKHLQGIRKFCIDKLGEAGCELDDPAADPVKVQLVHAIDVILAHRKAEEERDQGKLGLEGEPAAGSGDAAEPRAAPAKAGTPFPDATTTSDMLALNRKISQLLQHEKIDDHTRSKITKRLRESDVTAVELVEIAEKLQQNVDLPF